MRRSFVRLVVSSVLVFSFVGFVVLVLYGTNLSWTDERARKDGVFLFHEILNNEAAGNREAKRAELSRHTSLELSIYSLEQVEEKLGRVLAPGESAPLRLAYNREWYFFAFDDGSGALAVGPVNPATPPGVLPIGLIIGAALLPLAAALIAFRLERGISKVERASQAFASGDLSTRIEGAKGPATELAANFNDMAERIERLVRSRDELVQAVSHELGSPLSRLRFRLELLSEQGEQAQAKGVASMSKELDALDELVSELLSYVQSDSLAVEHQDFAVGTTLEDLVELAKLEAPPGRQLNIDVRNDDVTTVFVDPKLFQRAIENLLRNAVRHAASTVHLTVTSSGNEVHVTVHDDGPGIPLELREKVLTPFYRVDSDRGRDTGGTGLGLAIVTRIVERHDGSIFIGESPLGGAKVQSVWPKRPTA